MSTPGKIDSSATGLSFLEGGGDVGAQMRALDWAKTPLGPPAAWPQPLKTLVGVMLSAGQPMFIAWGPQHTLLYNDVYTTLMGGPRQVGALGRSFFEVWPEIAHICRPFFEQVYAGKAVHMDEIEMHLDRPGRPPEAHFNFSYTPVLDERGAVAAVFCACAETTEQVLSRRREAQEAERQRALFQQMPGFVAILSGPAHVFEYVNDAYVAISGSRDFIGHDIRTVFPDLEHQGFYELLDRVYATGETFKASNVALKLANEPSELFIDFMYQPIRNKTNAVTGILVVGYDTTDRSHKDARRDALIQLSDLLRDRGDPVDIAYVAAELLGRTLGVSRVGYARIDHAKETLHVERDWTAPGVETLAGAVTLRDYGSFVDGMKRGEIVVVDDARLDERTATHAEVLQARSGTAFVNAPVVEHGQLVAVFFVNSARPRAWSEGDLQLIQEFANRTRTAVERVHSDRAARESAASLRELNATLEQRVAERSASVRLYRDVIEALASPVCVFDTDYRLIAFNRAHSDEFFRIFGHRVQLGEVFPDLFPPDQAPIMRGFMARALAGERYTTVEEFGDPALVKPYWEVSYAPLRDSGGRVIGAFHLAKDITARLRGEADLHAAQEQLRQSQKMEAVGQLTGGLAHDFNNLLAGISGSLELMQARIHQGRFGELERYIPVAQGAAKRAAALTHRLLAFSRRQTLDPKPTDVNQLIAGMQEMIQRTVGPAITVEVIGQSGLWPTLVDPSQLENALLNLCLNARDAMPQRGLITVETANKWLDDRAALEQDMPQGQYLSMSVTDTGSGMSQDVIDHVFEPFFTTKPIGEGTGLGLSMIYGFAKQSGGQVRIYSEVGKGTTVRIYLPRHHGEVDAEKTAPEPDALPLSEQRATVLIVDDEPTVRLLLADIIKDLGYTTIEAADSRAGLKILQSDARLDLLVTDVGLPGGMNGRQMADAARVARPDLKVLFITGYAETAVLGQGHLAPGMAVLTKPFPIETMAARIRTLIATN